VKKIVDAGAMRSPLLAAYLAASSRNFAVLTDYACMESFKGNADVNLRKSLEILSQYPKQVIVLKGTAKIIRLQPRGHGLHARLIDPKQTAGFGNFCRAVLAPGVSRPDVRPMIRQRAQKATAHFDTLTASTETVRRGMQMFVQSYTSTDLKILRTHQPVSATFGERIVKDILMTTALSYRDSMVPLIKIPQAGEIIYSFQFRHSLCCYALNLKWATDGGLQSVPNARLKNDLTDMTYAAYATFFDGLITNDQKLAELHEQAVWMLHNVFRP
jgi:hypothetical protein